MAAGHATSLQHQLGYDYKLQNLANQVLVLH